MHFFSPATVKPFYFAFFLFSLFDVSILYGYTNDHSHAEISKSPVSKVSPELAKHEAAQHKVSREMKRKRDADDIG